MVTIRINGRPLTVPEGTTVAAALWNAGEPTLRRSLGGEARGLLCVMGVCFECRVRIDGVPYRRACLEEVQEQMEIATG